MQVTESCDFLIAGAGFGGCLTGLILHQLGHRVIIFDSSTHPKFSIGESSTPLADACLRDLCQRYGLTGLAPLTSYGSVRRELPHLTVGLKRGFSYFRHQPGNHFGPNQRGTVEQMLVTAASSDELSDTHWLRSSIDSHFADQVRQAGIALWEDTHFERLVDAIPWKVHLRSATGAGRHITAKFLIDASGRSAVLATQLRSLSKLSSRTSQPKNLVTQSRAIFGHFRGVQRWQHMLAAANISIDQHPFDCDRAAVHHLIEHGWMWQLRFDNDVTSVGFAIEPAYYSALESLKAEEQFQQILQLYPSLRQQFADARCVAPSSGLQATGRLQYFNGPAAGERWACLPATVGFVDPLHSTGIAHTLYSLRALTDILGTYPLDPFQLTELLQSYSDRLEDELRLIDRLVYLSYATLHDFNCFVASCMLYFAASTYAEFSAKTTNSTKRKSQAFLNASSPEFTQIVTQALDMLAQCQSGRMAWDEYPTAIERLIAPFNLVGLCDSNLNNMYRATSATAEPDPITL
ncbi:MAG: tryptophan 7-halogenase [Aureliella sp.]